MFATSLVRSSTAASWPAIRCEPIPPEPLDEMMRAEPSREPIPEPVATVPPPQVDPRAAGVLLRELISTLRGPRREGTVEGGRPHLWLFGEAVDVAVPLRMLLAGLRRGDAARVGLGAETLAEHEAATWDPEGYLVSAAPWLGSRRGDPADELSLRLHVSSFRAPMSALLRADPVDTSTWLPVVIGLREAVDRELDRDRPSSDDPLVGRMVRLRAQLRGLVRSSDPRLPRVLGELLVHAWMAARALDRQPPYLREGGSLERLHRVCSLSEATLADLRWAAGRGGAWRDPGLMSTTPGSARARRAGGRRGGAGAHALEIRPLLRGSAGRWVEGEPGDGDRGPQVLFAPGTPFEVVEVVEHQGEGGVPHTLVRLTELSRAAAALREGATLPSPPRGFETPLYHYTHGLALTGIVADGEIGVAQPPPGVEPPVVWLSTRDEWEPSAAERVVGPSPGSQAERGRRLVRIAVDPELPLLSLAQWVRWAGVPADVAAMLEQHGRERGADPRQWACCPVPIERSRWRSVELLHPEHGWVPIEP